MPVRPRCVRTGFATVKSYTRRFALLLKLVPGQSVRFALTLRHYGKNRHVTTGQSHFAERSRPQFSRYGQQNRLFPINPALMNKHQCLVGGNKVAYYIAMCPVVRRHYNAHVAGAIDRPDAAKIQVLSHDLMESLPCQECNDIIFRVITIVCLDGQLPEKS